MISVGMATEKNTGDRYVSYQDGDITLLWDLDQAIDIALSILHMVSASREEDLLMATMQGMGVDKAVTLKIVELWREDRARIFKIIGEKDEQNDQEI